MDVLTLIESGGVVALAIVVWMELRKLRDVITTLMTEINNKQYSILERQAIMMDRIWRDKDRPHLEAVDKQKRG